MLIYSYLSELVMYTV